MGTALTVFIALAVISLALFLSRDNWFTKKRNNGSLGYQQTTKKPADQKKKKEESEERSWADWLTGPALYITIWIVAFDFIAWSMVPWFWHILFRTWATLIVFNTGFWAVLYLRTLKAREREGTQKVANMIEGMLILGLATSAFMSLGDWWKTREAGGKLTRQVRVEPGFSHGQPVSTVLSVIAGCESGGGDPAKAHQFVSDKNPVRNPPDGRPGTGSVGKWQINLSDPAIAKMVKDHGWDVEHSEEDNQAAAEFLYSQYKTAPWTASQSCWEPKLAALAGEESVLGQETPRPSPTRRSFSLVPNPNTASRLLDQLTSVRPGQREGKEIIVEAPVGEWSKIVRLPENGRTFRLNYGNKVTGKKWSVIWNRKEDIEVLFPDPREAAAYQEIEQDFPKDPADPIRLPNKICSFRVMSREAEPLEIPVLLSQ